MATAVITPRTDRRNAYRAKRTEAMPKHSLFGSALEIQDETGARQLDILDPKTARVPKTPTPRGPGQKFVLPDDVKENLPGAQIYERSRRKVDNQSEITKQVTADLRNKEEEALYRLAQTGYDNYQSVGTGIESSGTARPQWFTEADLAGSKQINIVGLNKNQSYNRDKYGPRAPVHNYSLIGDLLRPGMDFPRRERTEVQMRNLGYGIGDMRGSLVEGMKPPPPKEPLSARTSTSRQGSVTLPPNIKHQFGSKICDKLLEDKAVVDKTIQKQKDFKEAVQRKSKPFTIPEFTREMNPEYEMLGNALRMNVVPGYSADHKISTTKTSFNDQVHLFRHPDPDKYRYQKDELSTWSEEQVLWNRMTKAWGSYLGAQPVVRSAPGRSNVFKPKQPEQTKEPKPRQPRRRKQNQPKDTKQTERKNSGFEEIKFETPPITPTSEHGGKVSVSSVKRDNEFWEFYEKGKN